MSNFLINKTYNGHGLYREPTKFDWYYSDWPESTNDPVYNKTSTGVDAAGGLYNPTPVHWEGDELHYTREDWWHYAVIRANYVTTAEKLVLSNNITFRIDATTNLGATGSSAISTIYRYDTNDIVDVNICCIVDILNGSASAYVDNQFMGSSAINAGGRQIGLDDACWGDETSGYNINAAMFQNYSEAYAFMNNFNT